VVGPAALLVLRLARGPIFECLGTPHAPRALYSGVAAILLLTADGLCKKKALPK
jgi:hypothetical protein